MTDINRRTVLKGAAWSIPVVAVAVATPLAAASQPTETTPPKAPAQCIRLDKHTWQGVYTDGSTTHPMSNGEAMSSKEWGHLCRGVK